ncbi:hypothetical protein AB833_06945 [Chromatiales bacterium (ex Bugula neritina AB1)]|nr:hypothetical protein AB833_06945 [Chromatiales bacterium (ex Bugula neritina AB1)]
MKFLFDLFPLALFLIAYKFSDIYTATLVIIVASVAQVATYWIIHRRFEKMHLVSLALFIVLGGLTLYLRDKRFIMWKPTIVNWLFAAAFAGTALLSEKSLIQRMLDGQITMAESVWRKLSNAWVLFFIIAGFVNLYFAQAYISAQNELTAAVPSISTEQLADLDCSTGFSDPVKPLCESASAREKTWVTVKVFGLMGLTLIFVIGQGIFLIRHVEVEEEPSPEAIQEPGKPSSS